MRKLLLFLFLLLLCCAAVPFLIGYEIKENFYHLVQAFPADNPGVQILALDYEQGWLTSKAHVKISTPFPPLPSPLVESVDCDIHHGPLVKDPFFGHLTLALGSIETKLYLSGLEIQGGASDKSIMNIKTLIDLRNDWHSHFTQPALSFALPPILQFTGEDSEGNIDFFFEHSHLIEFTLFMKAKGFDITFDQPLPITALHFSSLTYERRARHDPLGFWLGTDKVNLSKVGIKKRDSSEITLQDFVFDGNIQRSHANFYELNLQVGVKEIQTTLEKLPTLGPIQLTIDVKNVSRNGVKELISFFQKPHQQPLTKEEQLAYLNQLPKLLTNTSLFTESLSINSPFGTLDNNARISWDSEAGLPTTFVDAMNKVNATISLSIATTLMDQLIILDNDLNPPTSSQASSTPSASIDVPAVPGSPLEPVPTPAISSVAENGSQQKPPSLKENIDAWIQQGYLLKEKDRYTVTIRRSKGAAWINDKALPSS